MCLASHRSQWRSARRHIIIIVPQVRTKMMCRSPLRSTPHYPRRFPTQKGTLSGRVCPSITRGFSSQIFFVFEKKLRLDIVTRGYDRGTACARSRVPLPLSLFFSPLALGTDPITYVSLVFHSSATSRSGNRGRELCAMLHQHCRVAATICLLSCFHECHRFVRLDMVLVEVRYGA